MHTMDLHERFRFFLRLSGVLAALWAGVTWPAPEVAMPKGPPPTLSEVVEAAFRRHPSQQELSARVLEAEALAKRADSLIAATPSVEGGVKTDWVGSRDGYRDWEAGVRLPLWRPGERSAQRAVAEQAEQGLSAGRTALYLEVAGAVRDRVWAAALKKNDLELARQEWDTALALERDVKRRVELGELAKTDLLLAQDTTITKHAAHLRAQTAFDNALQDYAQYTGVSRLPRLREEPFDRREGLPEGHPLLAELTAEVQRAQSRLRAVRRSGGGHPEVFVGANGERDDAHSDYSNRIAIALSLPLGFESHTGPALAAAGLERAQTQARYELVRRQLGVDLQAAERRVDSTQAELQLAEAQSRLARENLRLARVAFEVGETDLVGLLRVQRLAFAATRRTRHLTIQYHSAIAQYNQAAGVLP